MSEPHPTYYESDQFHAANLRAKLDCGERSRSLMLTPSPSARATFFYVQTMGRFLAHNHYFTERDGLDSYLILYTLSGSGVLRYSGQSLALGPGDAFWIDCHKAQYYATASGEEPWDFWFVHFNGAQAPAYYEWFAQEDCPTVHFDKTDTLSAQFEQLYERYDRHDRHAEIQGSQQLCQLMCAFLLQAGQGQDPNVPDYIQATLDYIDTHYAERILLDELAARQAVSKFHLLKTFKRCTGYTPNEYLIFLRINTAKDLLSETRLPVREIAARVGIENTSHFINLFKKYEGLTPLNYRKSWRPRRTAEEAEAEEETTMEDVE